MTNTAELLNEELSLSELLDKSTALRTEANELERIAKDLKAEKRIIDQMVVDMMNSMGISRTGNDNVNAVVVTKRLPNVSDWDAFYQFVNENNAPYLLQRRVSQKAVEEIVELGQEVPGVDFYEEEQLSLRKK
ncbi:MAG: hypothetical protein ACRBBW_16180 [Cellvibrionaceae bacterium]